MSTFKKLFASIAAVMIVVSTTPVAVFGQTSRSTEYQDAYAYAFANGITTMSSIDAANLAGTTTRGQAAKMISEFAMSMGKTPNTSANTCNFNDLGAVAGTDLADFAVTACQLGLMGINTNGVFNPMGTLSRAEFGTILSRVLFGDTYNGGNPFYVNHLNALNQAGLMNDLSNPERAIMRGDVMLLLHRSSDADLSNVTPGFCNDIETVFACTIDADGSMGLCPAACVSGNNNQTPTEVKAGGLSVSLNTSTLANNSQIPSTGTVRFAIVNFAASSSNVNLKTVELEKVGLASIPANTRVWFEKNGVRVTGRAAFTSEGKAILSFAPALVVKANATEMLDLYVELSSNPGFDFQFRSLNVDSSALSVNGGFTTPVLRTVPYSVSTATMNDIPGVGTANVTTNGMEIGAFSLAVTNTSPETRDASFKSITLRQVENASLANLGNVVLERNGQVVSTSYTVNGRDITFSVNDEIKDATTATYYIKATVNNVEQSTDKYQFELRVTSDLNIVEKTTGFRMTVTGAFVLDEYSIQGGDITFARTTSVPLSASYAGGTTNVTLMQGTMSSNTAITVEDPFLAYANTDTDAEFFSGFSTIYMSIGSSTFSYSPVANGGSTGASFGGSATINGTVQVKVRGTLKDTAPAAAYKFQALQLSSFARKEYASNGNPVASAIGSIEGVNVTVEATQLNVTKTDGLGNQNIALGTNNFTVLKLNLSTNQGNGIRVSRAVFATGTTAALALNNTTLTLLVNGTAVSTKQLQGASVTFDFPSMTVSQGNPVVLELRANFSEAFNTGDFQLVLSDLNAVDVLTSVSVSGYQTPTSATFAIGTANAQVTASNAPVLSSLLLSPSADQRLFAFRVKALNDDVRLRDITLTGTNLGNLNNFRLSTDGTNENVFATATTATATTVTFANINQTNAPLINKDQTATYFLLADVNSNTTANSVTMWLTAASVRASNGSTVTPSFSGIASNVHAIAENTAVVAKQANPNKELGSSALVFSVTAAGKDSVVLTGLTVRVSTAGYSGDAVIVYKNSVNANNIAFASDSYTNGADVTWSGSLYNAANATVDAGQTANYIVVLDNTRGDGTNATQSWTARLSNVFFGGIAGASFTNVGAFPMTDVK